MREDQSQRKPQFGAVPPTTTGTLVPEGKTASIETGRLQFES
ncbi:hypothetical protein QY917_03370 [Diaphorobacter sp. C33]|uniref:Uncharacterized protein n=1 Tax=Diaphorobacter nitroreducens TaxID=164759 RepID=A0AAX1WQW4_9BURK|nr:hypothetical protein [Diaphorobacter sp. C33]ROR40288.1 hypothetical protein EDC60_2807 [Diaphorobacter nitroreducens]WKK90205.1 hypothetical protein QY917_03370 [Diaphorobacter sp. C33]